MSNVREILKVKGSAVSSVSPKDTVKDVLRFMAEKNVGAVLVMDGKKIVGIFSERDFARHSAKRDLDLEKTSVKDIMTSRFICVISPSDTTEECMSLMTTKHIRHLPVIEDGELVGLVSIGDVVKRIIESHKFSIRQLESYMTGGYSG